MAEQPERYLEPAEQIRRDFARGWGAIGAAWGVAPSTATVQGYLLAHGGPLTETEVRGALGLSHRAALVALADCQSWGIIEQVPARRVGLRGPAARAWVPVDDNWEWFRRVAAARKERETDPVLPLLDECRARAASAGADELLRRLSALVRFVHLFDRGIATVVRTDSTDLARLFEVLGRLDQRTLDRLIAHVAAVPEDELAAAARNLARIPTGRLRRLVQVVGRPSLGRLLAGAVPSRCSAGRLPRR